MRKPIRQSPGGGMGNVLASPAFARLVVHFALHGDAAVHVRALQRRTGLAMSSLNRELRRLENLGLVVRDGDAARVLYHNADTPAWTTLRQLVRDFAEPAEVVEEAITGVPGIEAAFVYGSFARGDARADSDVDVLVVGDIPADAQLGHKAAEASLLLGRPVEVRAYTPDKLKRQIAAGNAVLGRILAGPKRWLVGDERQLSAAVA